MKSLKQAHAVIPTLRMFPNTAEQTQLFNYLHSNINFSRNERLCALTAQQKCMLLGCSNTLHSSSSNVSQLDYGTLLPTNGKKYSHWLLSIIKMRLKLPKQIWEDFRTWVLLYLYLHFCLLNCEGEGRKAKKERTVYCLWLHQAVCMRSQSVNLIVDIHLSLITWLQIGGHSYKTVPSGEKKNHFLFVIY